MSPLAIILLVLLILLLAGSWPGLGLHDLGYGPSGIVTVLLIVLIVLLLTGRL